MIIEDFVKNDIRLTDLRIGLQHLKASGVYSVLLEQSAHKADNVPVGVSPMETMALHFAHQKGYTAALDDLYNFFERFVKIEVEKPIADFGALDSSLADGEITEEEYAKLKYGEPKSA